MRVWFCRVSNGSDKERRAIEASFSYTAGSQNWSLTQSFPTSSNNLTLAFTANAAGQTLTRTPTASLAGYKYAPPSVGASSYGRNGLNQITSVAAASFTSDARGNLTSDGARSFGYDVENRLTSVSGAASMSLAYDPLGRLRQVVAGATTRQFLYDGADLVLEYDGAGAIKRRYVFGQSVDEPLVWYEGAGLTTRNWLHADELGSIIATSDGAGIPTPYAYDAYGRPSGDVWTGSRFRYTGQIALNDDANAKLYYYKARVYDPALGRFLQTDPIGYRDGLNWYLYAWNDSVKGTDPSGRSTCVVGSACRPDDWGTADELDVTAGLPLCNQQCLVKWSDVMDLESRYGSDHFTPNFPNPPQQTQARPGVILIQDDGSAAYNRELNICRALAAQGEPGAASRCYGSAELREAKRRAGVPEGDLPPLITWRQGEPERNDSNTAPYVAGGVLIIGGAICAVAEPCGAAVAATLATGGGLALVAAQ